MREYKADFHIHTVLSPCGDLDMSPSKIIETASGFGLDMIAITDHNSTKHGRVSIQLGKEKGIVVFPGAEVNSKEEVHCLTLFETLDQAELFQLYIDKHMPNVPNAPDIFGEQVIVDENEMIVAMEERYLGVALNVSIDDIEKETHRLGGLFIPSHVNRQRNSLLGQLGFLPPDLNADAYEVAKITPLPTFIIEHPEFKSMPLIKNSDAHHVHQIGDNKFIYFINEPTFSEIKLALHGLKGRYIKSLLG